MRHNLAMRPRRRRACCSNPQHQWDVHEARQNFDLWNRSAGALKSQIAGDALRHGWRFTAQGPARAMTNPASVQWWRVRVSFEGWETGKRVSETFASSGTRDEAIAYAVKALGPDYKNKGRIEHVEKLKAPPPGRGSAFGFTANRGNPSHRKTNPRQQAFDVYRPKRTGAGAQSGALVHLDTVFYDLGMTIEEVKRSLVEHDGYPSDIRVVKRVAKPNPFLQTVFPMLGNPQTLEWATPSQAEAGLLAHKLGRGSKADGSYVISSAPEKKVREVARQLGVSVAKSGAMNPRENLCGFCGSTGHSRIEDCPNIDQEQLDAATRRAKKSSGNWSPLPVNKPFAWAVFGRKQDSYVPSFRGTFEEAIAFTKDYAKRWNTQATLYSADDAHYRRRGWERRVWAIVHPSGKVTLKNPLTSSESADLLKMSDENREAPATSREQAAYMRGRAYGYADTVRMLDGTEEGRLQGSLKGAEAAMFFPRHRRRRSPNPPVCLKCGSTQYGPTCRYCSGKMRWGIRNGDKWMTMSADFSTGRHTFWWGPRGVAYLYGSEADATRALGISGLQGGTVEPYSNIGGLARNPLTKQESSSALRVANANVRGARKYSRAARMRAFLGGKAAGIAETAERFGPQDFRSREVAAHVWSRATDAGYYGMGGVQENPRKTGKHRTVSMKSAGKRPSKWWRVSVSYRDGGPPKTAMFAAKAGTSAAASADVRKQIVRLFPGAKNIAVKSVIPGAKPAQAGHKPLARKNPSDRCPYKVGQRVSVDQWRAWLKKSGQGAALETFNCGIALQKKANGRCGDVLVADEKDMGVAPGTTLVHYGSTDETTYKAPKGSIKGRSWYRHQWGEGKGKKKRVPLLVDSGGKKIVIPLGKGQKAGDWLRG